MRPLLTAVALSLLLLPAAANAQVLQPGAPRADDGGVTFVKPPPRKPPAKPVAAAPPVAELTARPRFSPLPDPAPRTRGYQELRPTGGGACRTGCANAYYLCLPARDMSACGAAWAQCQSACPDTTAGD
ncbi:MAG TPA: hypothetical protein VF559_01395 [Caulobacteraceae bacterium]|jgi:hypothetical protein